MDAVRFIKALRRNWYYVVAAIVVGVLASILVWHPGAAPNGRYKATATLVRSATAAKSFSMSANALYVNEGAVPRLAARSLQYTGDPDSLARTLSVSSNDKVGTITITYSGNSARTVTAVVNAFAAAMVDTLQNNVVQQAARVSTAAQRELDSINKQLTAIDTQIAAQVHPSSALLAQRSALMSRFQAVSKTLNDASVQALQPPPVDELPAIHATAVGSSGIGLLRNAWGRAGVAGLVGLLLGLVVVYAVGRFDVRLRDLDAIEESFGLPVLAEVPLLPRARRAPGVEILRQPESTVAEAYRSLRASVQLASNQLGAASGAHSHAAVILVTSAVRGEGRTSTVVNLAACLAETGRSVLVLDCDFRSPAAHRFFDRPDGRGLSDLLAANLVSELAELAKPTSVAAVSLVTSGTSIDQPAALLSRMGALLAKARQLADVVIIDSPPVLESNDATDLVRLVDSVLLVGRVGMTTINQAERTADLLGRMRITPIGVALIGRPAHTPGTGSTRRWATEPVTPAGPAATPHSRPAPRLAKVAPTKSTDPRPADDDAAPTVTSSPSAAPVSTPAAKPPTGESRPPMHSASDGRSVIHGHREKYRPVRPVRGRDRSDT